MYKMPDEIRDSVTTEKYWTCDRIERNLEKLRLLGPDHFDRPQTLFEESTGNDYDGYTQQWLDLLGAEKDRRIEAGTWVLHSRVS
jgi:hypothetical protein